LAGNTPMIECELSGDRTMSPQRTQKAQYGFTLLELMIAVAVMLVLAGILAPMVVNTVDNIKLRYSASDFSGLCQKARIDAARKNTFYQVQSNTMSGVTGYFADESAARSGVYASGEPIVEMANQVNFYAGTGSGAPGESTFVASLGFPVGASTPLPGFNARGLPCFVSGSGASETCAISAAGNGFVYFLSRNGVFGTSWAAVAITPSGHVKVYTYDGAHWMQL
jgi:prepilin-type N-terminal cleavage/methylation domain-containing protein